MGIHRLQPETPDGFVNYFGHTGDTGGDYLDDVEMPNIAGVSSQANIMTQHQREGRNSPRGMAGNSISG